MFFPESYYPPASLDYADRLAKGFTTASKLNVLITGVVRDGEKEIGLNLARIDYLRRFFAKSYVFVYENDSVDNTKEIINKWRKSRYNTVFYSEKLGTRKLADRSLERRINMATARNKYLEYARKLKDIHKIIILDLDLAGGYSFEGVLHSLSYNEENSIYTSNGLMYRNTERLFYDTWSYRDLDDNEGSNYLLYNRGEDLVKVNSNFSALSIYPSSILDYNIKYTSSDCDHVTINNQLTKYGYNIFLNPSQITLYNLHYYCY